MTSVRVEPTFLCFGPLSVKLQLGRSCSKFIIIIIMFSSSWSPHFSHISLSVSAVAPAVVLHIALASFVCQVANSASASIGSSSTTAAAVYHLVCESGERCCQCLDWCVSSAVVHAVMACREFMNRDPISVSAADDTTDLLIWGMFNTSPLFPESSVLSDIK